MNRGPPWEQLHWDRRKLFSVVEYQKAKRGAEAPRSVFSRSLLCGGWR